MDHRPKQKMENYKTTRTEEKIQMTLVFIKCFLLKNMITKEQFMKESVNSLDFIKVKILY